MKKQLNLYRIRRALPSVIDLKFIIINTTTKIAEKYLMTVDERNFGLRKAFMKYVINCNYQGAIKTYRCIFKPYKRYLMSFYQKHALDA